MENAGSGVDVGVGVGVDLGVAEVVVVVVALAVAILRLTFFIKCFFWAFLAIVVFAVGATLALDKALVWDLCMW